MKFRFKAGAGNIGVIVAFVCTVLALVFSIISNTSGGSAYPVTPYGMVIAFCAVALVLEVASVLFDCIFHGKLMSILNDVIRFVIAGLLIACFSVMITSRGDLMGYIWFSDLESGNPDAVNALYMALASWITYFLGVIALAVSTYYDLSEKVEETEESGDAQEAQA